LRFQGQIPASRDGKRGAKAGGFAYLYFARLEGNSQQTAGRRTLDGTRSSDFWLVYLKFEIY
ncbi:MAG TPA: hypothetical protein VMV39_05535, partial [Terracidiphilus sp.]|nr:hypothetical protein [Terracidiphilus sp.]